MKKLALLIFVMIFASVSLSAVGNVQTVANRTGGVSAFSVSFPASTVAGNMVIVGFDFYKSAVFQSISDLQGNVFTEAGTQVVTPGGSASRVYYAQNIKGGPETITVALTAPGPYLEVYISEYTGLTLDSQASATGTVGVASSGNANTTVPGDVIYGYCVSDGACSKGGLFAQRVSLDGNLVEDMTAGAAGSYATTATSTSGWSMQMVALKPASPSVGDPEVVYDQGTITVPAQSLNSTACWENHPISPVATTAMRAVVWSNTDLSSILGFVPTSAGVPTIYNPTVSAGQVNVKICNNTSNPINIGSFPLSWVVQAP